MRSIFRLLWALTKATWNVFAALCIVAGGFADGPGLFGAFHDTGILGVVTHMVSTTFAMVAAEPMGFAALVIAVALAADRLRPIIDRLRMRLSI